MHDLALYGAAWMNSGRGLNGQTLLQGDTVDAALRLGRLRGEGGEAYGFAWYPTEPPHSWIHSGLDLGSASAVMFSRERGAGAAIVRNTDVELDEEPVLTRVLREVENAGLL